MTESFQLNIPRSIRFGPGERRNLPELLGAFGRRLLLVTTSSWFLGSAYGEEMLQQLGAFEVEHLACPPGEPTVGGLDDLLRRGRLFHPDAVLAVGGGSAIDTAKALSGLLSLPGSVEQYLEGAEGSRPVPRAGVPWVAVPTTSGTGAEVTMNAVVRSERLKAKRSIRSPWLLATHVVVDPELTLDCPLGVSGTAGLDALVQLVESYVSRKRKPMPRALVRGAFPATLAALHRIPVDPADLQARTDAAYGSLVSGIALANSGLGAAHGFAAGLGGLFPIPHGLICAVTMGPVLAANAALIREDLRVLLDGKGGSDPAAWLRAEFEELLAAFGLPLDLKSYRIDPALVPEIARLSSGSSMSGNPRDLDPAERAGILSRLI